MRIKKLILVLILSFLCLNTFSVFAFKKEKDIRNIEYIEENPFDFDLHSNAYLLMRLSDLKVLYAHNINEKIYPASLTKIMTLNTILRLFDDLSETSSINQNEVNELIKADASLAYLRVNQEYSIEDLLYALILPSGADGAKALEKYCISKNIDLVKEMNKGAKKLKMNDSNFANTTGLHLEDNYTTVNDLLTLVLDTLKYEKAREILESLDITLDDSLSLSSTLSYLKNDRVRVLGGKTGYTPDAGELIVLLFRHNHRSYLWISAAAMGRISQGELFHYEDAQKVMEEIVNE